MKLVLIDNSLIKNSFEAITHIVDEVVCHIDNEGFRINAIDRSHVIFVELDLKYTVFDEFDIEVPEKICLDTQEFHQILKRMKKNDVLMLSIDENNLIITLEGEVTRNFKIRLIDTMYETPIPPTLDMPANIEVDSSLFKDFIADMELFNENCKITVNEEYFIVSTESDFGDSKDEYLHGDIVNGEYSSSFSLDKLKTMMKADKFSKHLELGIGNDMPVTVRFTLDGGDGYLNFLLAPRLDADDE